MVGLFSIPPKLSKIRKLQVNTNLGSTPNYTLTAPNGNPELVAGYIVATVKMATAPPVEELKKLTGTAQHPSAPPSR